MYKGIDLSEHNGIIDFQSIKNAGIDFVIIRAGYGDARQYPNQKDKQFERNYTEAKKYKLKVGAYWYSYAENASQAEQEAKAFLSIIQGKQFEYPVYIDIEEQHVLNKGKTVCDSIIKSFCSVMEKANYFVGYYCSTYWTKTSISTEVASRYTSWIADWNTQPSITWYVWQYTNSFAIAGTKVDGNYSNTDFATIIKQRGKNGFTAKTAVLTANSGDKFIKNGKIYDVLPFTSVNVSLEGVKNYEVY